MNKQHAFMHIYTAHTFIHEHSHHEWPEGSFFGYIIGFDGMISRTTSSSVPTLSFSLFDFYAIHIKQSQLVNLIHGYPINVRQLLLELHNPCSSNRSS